MSARVAGLDLALTVSGTLTVQAKGVDRNNGARCVSVFNGAFVSCGGASIDVFLEGGPGTVSGTDRSTGLPVTGTVGVFWVHATANGVDTGAPLLIFSGGSNSGTGNAWSMLGALLGAFHRAFAAARDFFDRLT